MGFIGIKLAIPFFPTSNSVQKKKEEKKGKWLMSPDKFWCWGLRCNPALSPVSLPEVTSLLVKELAPSRQFLGRFQYFIGIQYQVWGYQALYRSNWFLSADFILKQLPPRGLGRKLGELVVPWPSACPSPVCVCVMGLHLAFLLHTHRLCHHEEKEQKKRGRKEKPRLNISQKFHFWLQSWQKLRETCLS